MTLTFFVLDTLERVLDILLKSIVERKPFFKSQHASLNVKYTETALLEIISMAERSLHYQHYTLVVFLDIAFNNISINATT